MNVKNLAIAGLIGALVSLIFANVPILSFTNCLLCAPFWASAILAVWIYKRQTGTLTLGQGVIIGLVAGAAAGIVGFLLSFVGLAGGEAVMNTYKSFVPADTGMDIPSDVPSVLFNLCGIGVELVFGAIGGLIGGLLFRTQK
jgi:NADPH-dependent curcumin reductase CurA